MDIIGTVQRIVKILPIVSIEIPDGFHKGKFFPVPLFGAVAAHVRAAFSVILDYPFNGAVNTAKLRKIHEDDRITISQPERQGAPEISVDNPLGFDQFVLQQIVKFLWGYGCPLIAPIQDIQMGQGQTQPDGQLFCQGRFAAAVASYNQHSLQSLSPHNQRIHIGFTAKIKIAKHFRRHRQ